MKDHLNKEAVKANKASKLNFFKDYPWHKITVQIIGVIAITFYLFYQRYNHAPPLLKQQDLAALDQQAQQHQANFDPSLADHYWFKLEDIRSVNGQFAIDPQYISFIGKLKPGFDYQLWLTQPCDKCSFAKAINQGIKIGAVESFHSFILKLPDTPNLLQKYPVLLIGSTIEPQPLISYNYQYKNN